MGFTAFKIKVGQDLQDDIRRLTAVRNIIGWENKLVSYGNLLSMFTLRIFKMVDANQVWDVNEAIEWVTELSKFKLVWIEEPTSPDDILGHATISKALKSHDISVATGEMCSNRIMFKQFFQADAMQYCQVDAARIGGVNEILSVYLMARKFGGEFYK